MDELSTDTLRSLSTKWSLAADEKLLNLLQSTHQKIISKCQDANSKLEEMALALDDASINLQNVNNKFMALSNSQFIESRVYDDDSETDGQIITKEQQMPSKTDELTIIKNSLAILDKVHEITEIIDDSDSDSDAEISVVLKPKDMYTHRPLPYIIGSQAWKNKWHAGLILEESDSDSTISKHEEIEIYSESESDNETHKHIDVHNISESSSSFTSEQEPTTKQLLTTQQDTTKQQHKTPADIAAELARRLAGPIQVVPQEPDDYLPPSTNKVYKPEQPLTSTIFPDEPPPLDAQECSSEDEDIFAEINKHKPYQQHRNHMQPNLADDLFGFNKQTDIDIFSDIASPNVNTPRRKSPLFSEDEPESFEPKKDSQNNDDIEKQDNTSKKPIGGISLFGANKESIGAAILKKKRKSSSSDDDSENDMIPKKNVQEKPNIRPRIDEKPNILPKVIEKPKNIDELDKSQKEKDIFDDLFAKPKEKKPQKVIKEVKSESKNVKEQKNVKDLFNNDIFDDIDDIFTNNVVVTKENKPKSIFDDDDLFNDIAEPKTVKQANNDRKNIFDRDDELFSDLKPKSTQDKITEKESRSNKDNENSKNRSQNDAIESTPIIDKNSTHNVPVNSKTDINKERSLFDDEQRAPENTKLHKKIKMKSIFDSDSDEDIFADIKSSINTENLNKNKDKKDDLKNKQTNLKVEAANVIQSPSLFDDDDDELFASANKNNKIVNKELGREEKDKNILSEDKIEKDVNASKIFETVIKNNTQEESEKDLDATKNLDTVIKDKDIINEPKDTNIKDRAIFFEDKIETDLGPSKHLPVIEEKSENKEITQNNNQTTSAIDTIFENDSDNSFDDPKEIKNLPKVIESSQNSDKSDFKYEEKRTDESIIDDVIQETPKETNLQEQVKEKDTNKEQIKEKETLTPTINSPISIFDDIFSEPPEFEKPAEPKKSKNVNALFDDDSDDEALFFKKNDIVSDEKPEIFTNNANFDIFINEPPAIDVDFTTKSKNLSDNDLFSPNIDINKKDLKEEKVGNTSKIGNEHFTNSEPSPANDSKVIKDENNIKIGSAQEKTVADTKTNDLGEEFDKDLFKTEKKTEEKSIFSKEINSDDELFGDLTKSSQNYEKITEKDIKPDLSESPKKDESKKIGKLNTKNFNINVNALIPGASPKKIPKDAEIQSKSVKENDEIDNLITPNKDIEIIPNENQNTQVQSKSVKQYEIDNVKETDVNTYEKTEFLDNNASKQRPRIQVKRRPSTRKARHEAARKSGIDFGDNTNIDESRIKTDKIRPNIEENTKVPEFHEKDTASLENSFTDNSSSKDLKTKIDANFDESATKNVKVSENSSIASNIINKTDKSEEINKKSTTKIVYILNDEDIFSSSTNTLETKPQENTNTLETKLQENTNIETLGNTYKKEEKATEMNKDKIKDTKSSLFEDSDEELFKTDKKITKKVNIFESDSEDDLFTGKQKDKHIEKKTGKQKKDKHNEQKKREKVKVKESLFSDDDDDLFGVKSEKIESKPSMPSTSKEPKKSTQPVFDDPLSMLGED